MLVTHSTPFGVGERMADTRCDQTKCQGNPRPSMFLVDRQFRLDAPEALRSPGTDFFYVVESTMDLTVWIARVLDARGEASDSRYRKFFVNEASLALEIVGLPHWSARTLHVLLPAYVTGLTGMVVRRCSHIWKCDEPDGVGSCWRVHADGQTVLISASGTSLGEEVNPDLVWND